MENNHCLNCDTQIDNKFCPNCGQKTDTHPITFKHFIFHDLLHGVWHLEKGILFTIKETFKRPGQAALDYIKGKRIRYYNVFYLALLVIALNVVLLHYKQSLNEPFLNIHREEDLGDFISKFSKITLFSIVPLLSINALLLFKRLKLNFAQHLIIGGVTLLGMLLISIFYFLFDLLNQLDLIISFGYLEIFSFCCIPLFPIWSYYNATKGLYTIWGFIWRIILFYMLLFIQFLILFTSIVFIFLDGKSSLEIAL